MPSDDSTNSDEIPHQRPLSPVRGLIHEIIFRDFPSQRQPGDPQPSSPQWNHVLETQSLLRRLSCARNSQETEIILLDFQARPLAQRQSLRASDFLSESTVQELRDLAHTQAASLVLLRLVPQDSQLVPRTLPCSIHGIQRFTAVTHDGLGGFPLRDTDNTSYITIGEGLHCNQPSVALGPRLQYHWFDPFHSDTPNHLQLSQFEHFSEDASVDIIVSENVLEPQVLQQGPELQLRPIYHDLWWPESNRCPQGQTPWLCIRYFLLPQGYLNPDAGIPPTYVEDEIEELESLWDRTIPFIRYTHQFNGVNFHVLERFVTGDPAPASRYAHAVLEHLRSFHSYETPTLIAHLHLFRNSYPSFARLYTLFPNDDPLELDTNRYQSYERPVLIPTAWWRDWLIRFRQHEPASN